MAQNTVAGHNRTNRVASISDVFLRLAPAGSSVHVWPLSVLDTTVSPGNSVFTWICSLPFFLQHTSNTRLCAAHALLAQYYYCSWLKAIYWHCQYNILSRVYERVQSVCMSVCPNGPTAANPLLQVCCCGPSRQEISIDYSSSRMRQANAEQCQLVSICR